MNSSHISALILQRLEEIEVERKKKELSLSERIDKVSQLKLIKGDKGADGAKGAKGADGAKGAKGADGAKGNNGDSVKGDRGEDGVGIENVDIDFDGNLTVTLTDGNQIDAGSITPLKDRDVYISSTVSKGEASLTWIDYATGFTSDPTLTQTIATGDVYTYTYASDTLYRLVPSGSEQDAFYSVFAGGVLSALVATKRITI